MTRPIRATIDLAAFRHNYRHAKSLADQARAVAVIKANGYGHGAIPIARSMSGEVDAFGVASIDEALELRESGIRDPILLLEGVFEPDEFALVDRLGLSTVIHSVYQLDWLAQANTSRGIECWLKIDTGMHRLGIPPTQTGPLFERLSNLPQCGDLVLMSHFARADETDSDATRRQLADFQQTCDGLAYPRSLANSAAILAWPQAHADWIRPGIMLYGASPIKNEIPTAAALRPVMQLASSLIAIRELDAGSAIGYGGRYRCANPTRVGVVACGYGDGYPRHAIDGTPVAVKGVRTQVIGRVSMDMITVDLTPVDSPRVGDPVELWGNTIPANEVAKASETIAYELFTSVTSRVPLRYADSGS